MSKSEKKIMLAGRGASAIYLGIYIEASKIEIRDGVERKRILLQNEYDGFSGGRVSI